MINMINMNYVTVTGLTDYYCQDFDQDFWSSYKALEQIMKSTDWVNLRNILLSTKKFKEIYLDRYKVDKKIFYQKKQEISNSYDIARTESAERGTKIHKEKETYITGNFELIPEIKEHSIPVQTTNDLNITKGVFPEFPVTVTIGDLIVSGKIDLLVLDNEDVYIIDYKAVKEIKKTSYFDKRKKKNVMMKFPLNNLQDSPFNHYAIQVSLYMFMLQKLNPNLKCKKLQIIHIQEDGSEHTIEIPYLKSDVERMIKHYAKTVRVKSQLDRLKPVIL